MAGEHILIIEDEAKIVRFLELELSHEGYKVSKEYDGRTGFARATQPDEHFELILLDVMLPSLNGMEVLRRLRMATDERVRETPVIMLTAKDQIMDKVMGLDIGADDYITKPFAIEELLARIRVALKHRRAPERQSVVSLGALSIDEEKRSVTYSSEPVQLTKREYDLLAYLSRNKNIVLSRDSILENVWGYDYFGDTNVVDVYIRYLRNKIDDKYRIKLISTIRGVGYMISEPQEG